MVVRAGPPLPSSPSWLQFSFSDFISDSCRCSALPSGSGCLRVFCYKRVTFTQLDQSPIRHRDTTPSLRPTIGTLPPRNAPISAHSRWLQRRPLGGGQRPPSRHWQPRSGCPRSPDSCAPAHSPARRAQAHSIPVTRSQSFPPGHR